MVSPDAEWAGLQLGASSGAWAVTVVGSLLPRAWAAEPMVWAGMLLGRFAAVDLPMWIAL